MNGNASSGGSRAPGGGTVPTEDFLYHLHRGSDLLMQDRMVEAKEELERALAYQPQDAKSQDLLAGVYFRLGVYPRAIEIWGHLVRAYPADVTLRVNLGLAMFKTGQHDEALEHIHEALRIQPDHERAWGYLGLIHWRRGQLEQARDAFLRGGQATMARRMEETLGSSSGDVSAVPVSDEQEAASAVAQERERSLRSAADEAIERVESEELRLAVAETAERSGSGAWQTRAPGEEPVPLVHRRSRTLAAAAGAPTLADAIGRWTLDLPEGVHLHVGPGGELHVQAEHEVFVRLEGLAATRGTFRTSVVRRRARGKDLDETLGDDNPIMKWHGPVAAMLVPPEGRRFHAMQLEAGDLLCLLEELLFAFDLEAPVEMGRLPVAGQPAVLAQVQGPGAVVLCLGGEPRGMRVEERQEVRVDPNRLVGWTGRLLPTNSRGTLPYAATAPPLAFRGEGTVFVA
ncbi:MAG: tetratricopeptide repeat protein [Myxococcota bacterium]